MVTGTKINQNKSVGLWFRIKLLQCSGQAMQDTWHLIQSQTSAVELLVGIRED